MEVTRSLRYRVQVSQTSTGKKSWECTCESDFLTQPEILALSDILVAELQRRYPPEFPEPKVKEK